MSFYMQKIKMHVLTWMEGRQDFITGVASTIIFNLSSILFFWVMFQNVSTLNGWTFEQMLFLTGFDAMVFGLWDMFLMGASPWVVTHLVKSGTFDRLLVEPKNTLYNVITFHLSNDGLAQTAVSIALIAYASSALGIEWTIMNVALFALMIFGAVLILTSVFLMIATLSFWTTETEEFASSMMEIMNITRYPFEIFHPMLVFVFTFVFPIGFMVYYPAQIFVNKGIWMGAAYLTPVVGLIMFGVAYSFWKFGLKHYSSAGG